MPDLTGHKIGRYHMLEKLGEGGMAVVYKAYDAHLETEVAVKIIRTENLPQSAVERALKRFEREAKALAKLTHPNIVKVTDYGEYTGRPFLVMPYLPGGTLKTKLGQPIPFQEAAQLLLPIAEALRYAHSQHVIHRDVKPANILLTHSGHPMLTDFGIVKLLDLEETADLTGTSAALGTPEYMAPEQANAKTVDPRADIYSLGIVLYEMLTGRKPFVADTPLAVLVMHMHDPLPVPRKVVPDLPEHAENILLKALAKRPEDRFQTMEEFASALTVQPVLPAKPAQARKHKETMGTTAESLMPAPTRLPPQDRPHARFRWLPLAGVVLGLALLFAVFSWAFGAGGADLFPARLPVAAVSPAKTAAPYAANTPSASPTPSLHFGSTWISPRDHMTMRYVPAGEFSMGSNDGFSDNTPVHKVYLDAFWMDQTEVTNDMFSKFVEDTAYTTDAEKSGSSYVLQNNHWNLVEGVNWKHPNGSDSDLSGLGDHPVVHVSWNDAKAYCEWADRRLPTEAEWEKAAGWDGTQLKSRNYPWGDAFTGSLLNYCDQNCSLSWAENSIDDGYEFTSPVGTYPGGASFYGILDLAGNVSEWVADWWNKTYYSISPTYNPMGPNDGEYHVIRGGSWNDEGGNSTNDSYFHPWIRLVTSDVDNTSDGAKGFRCARPAD